MGVKMIKICVYGLWHLGLVTVTCLAKKGFEIIALDTNMFNINETILNLPIHEPNLQESIDEGILNGKLSFIDNIDLALTDSNVLWITFDTPLDVNDNAQPDYIIERIREVFPFIKDNTLVIISSQLIVGSTRKLQSEYEILYPDKNVTFVYSPENLVRGNAIEGFNHPDRIIIGIDNHEKGNKTIVELLSPFCKSPTCNMKWMSLESAEMVKHTLNSFLALSISFANEVEYICKSVGANYQDVELSLKSDSRIGKKAYLRAGEAYSGGTLARDVNYLHKLSETFSLNTPLVNSINISNNLQKERLVNKKCH